MRKKRGESLIAVLVGIVIFGLISIFFIKSYVVINNVYQNMSVQSDVQRNLRILICTLSKEMREASATFPTSSPILEPTSSVTTSSRIRFTHVIDPDNTENPSFQTIRYTYSSSAKTLTRQVEGQSATRIICRDLSSMVFQYIDGNTVKANFTVSKTYKAANKTDKAVSSGGELYLFARQEIR